LQPHLGQAFRHLKKSLFTLSAAVEDNLHVALQALESGDPRLIDQVRTRDLEIDLMEVDFEEECLKILALHQPVAIDLRFVISVLKINNDLERIGDLAVNIAESTPDLMGKRFVDTASRLPKMAEKAQAMLRKSLDSVVNMDAELAREVLAADDSVDDDYQAMVNDIRTLLRQDGSGVDELLSIMVVSKHIERIADLATNIAEDTIYLVAGDIVRHGRHHVTDEN